jgi:hypothetical protein
MTRKLLILATGGAAVCLASFTLLQVFDAASWAMAPDRAEGPTITRDLAWTGTDAVHIGGASDITYTQGPVAKITVTGPAEVVNGLSMDGDTLERRHQNPWFFDHQGGRLIIAITSPHTHEFGLSGSNRLTLLKYDQSDLDLHLSGSSHVTGTGKAGHAQVHVSGSGHVDMGKLPVDAAEIRISGSGSAILDPKQSADVNISGSGRIDLLTKPASLRSHISGSGSINTPDGVSKDGRG